MLPESETLDHRLQAIPISAEDQLIASEEFAAGVAANYKAQQAMQERFRASQRRAESESVVAPSAFEEEAVRRLETQMDWSQGTPTRDPAASTAFEEDYAERHDQPRQGNLITLSDQVPLDSRPGPDRGAASTGVNSTDEAGRTALMHAAGEGDAQALRRQLSRGAAVDATDECRCTALMYAATYGHLEAVRCLAEHGAAVEATSKDGWTPLITAAYNGHLEVVRHLLTRGACIEAADERGWTSLMHVAFNGDNETLRCLLQHNASVDTLDSDGRTALVYAAFNGHLDNVRCLLERGAKESKGGPMLEGARDTALLFASIHGHVEVVRLLLEVATATPETRHAALKLAADHGHHGVVELLVQRSATDVNSEPIPQ